MMTSLLLVDVQGFEALAKGQANPTALTSELSHTMHGLTRQIAVMRAYCSNRVSSYRRTAYREAGFEIIETAGADETLIRLSVDLHKFATSAATYEEAILLGGTTDYTALARLAREHLMMVSVVDHPTISSALEAIADGLIDLDDLEIDRSTNITSAPSFASRDRAPIEPLAPRAPFSSRPAKSEEQLEEKFAQDVPKLDHPEDRKPDNDASDGDAWPDPKSGPILVAGTAAGAGAAALMTNKASANGADTTTHASSDDAAPVDASKGTDEAKVDESKIASDSQTKTKTDTDTKAETASIEPAIEAELEDAIAASLSDVLTDSVDEDLSKTLADEKVGDFGNDLDAELEAELTAELVPDLAVEADDSATQNTATANGADLGSDVSVDDDSTIDALFADIAGGDEELGPDDADTTSVDPAVTAAPIDIPMMADVKADADVDQLLSRLMSDDLGGEATEPKKAELDVVPER